MSFASELNKQRKQMEDFRNNHGPEKKWVLDAINRVKSDATNANNMHGATALEGYFYRDNDGDWFLDKCDEAEARADKFNEFSAPTKLIFIKDYVEDTTFIVNELRTQLTQLGFKNICIKIFSPDLLGTKTEERWTLFGNKKVTRNTYVKSHAYFKVLYLKIEW